VACVAADDAFVEYFELGSAAVKRGELSEAYGHFRAALIADPSSEPVKQLLAKLEAAGVAAAKEEGIDEIERELLDDGDDDDFSAGAAMPPTGGAAQADRIKTLAALGRGSSASKSPTDSSEPSVPPPAEPPSPNLDDGAKVVVVGGSTPVGQRVVKMLAASGLTAVVDDGSGLDGAQGVVIVSEAAGGAGGVPPSAMAALMARLPDEDPRGGGVRRVVYLSAHGVERTAQMPFALSNVFGQLDKLRAAEQEVALRAMDRIPAFSLVRVGKIAADGEGVQSLCELAPGDALQGEVPASAVGSVLAQTLTRAEVVNASFSVGPSTAAGVGAGVGAAALWSDEFLKLEGPEIYRRPLSGVSAEEAALWLREWGRGFLKAGQRLTTPIQVEQVTDGVLLRFKPPGAAYEDDDEGEGEAKWPRPRGVAGEDGALRIVAEASPAARVRVVRAEMGAGVSPKEMSEEAVIARLQRDLPQLEGARR